MNTALTLVTIIAIILGPILAIRIQKFIERVTQRRDEKRRIFMTLMATRDERILREHVHSLNMIDVIFSGKGKKDKAVVEAWAEYRDHLNDYPREPSGQQLSDTERTTLQHKRDGWSSKCTELLIELLDKMAESLNYHFDKVFLKKGAYTPSGYGEEWAQQYAIRRGLIELLYGKPLPINIVAVPPTEEKKDSQKVSSDKTKKEVAFKSTKQDAQQEKPQQ